MGFQGQGNQACTNAIDAASQQSGIEQRYNKTESTFLKKKENQSIEFVGKDNAKIIAGTAIVVNTVASRQAIIDLPKFGLCDSFRAELKSDSGILRIKWFF
jgi:hypothetical protein